MKNKIYDKESNGMLNLVTLMITNKEADKELYSHKVKLFDLGAEYAVIFAVGSLCNHALNYWVLKNINIP